MNNDALTVTISTSEYENLMARKAELEALVKYYEEQLRLAKHRQFGSSSEKGEAPEQLGLFDEAENAANPKLPELEEITYKRKKRVGKREDDLSALSVETVDYDLPESEQICSDCGGALHTMGHDIRRELKIIPAQVKVVEHKRTVYSCRHCENHSDHVPIVKAPMPEPVIRGSLASPSAVAHIYDQCNASVACEICDVRASVSAGTVLAAGGRFSKPPDDGELGDSLLAGLAGAAL